MSEKSLKFDSIGDNKKEFHKSKQPISSDLVNIDQIVISDKYKHSDDGFKYFIGYKEREIVMYYLIYIKLVDAYNTLKREGKTFLIKDDVLHKYNEIWNKIKKTLKIEFHSMPVYDEKYILAKVREFNSVDKTSFLGDKIPKENVHYICIACVTIDSVMKMKKKKKELSTSLFKIMQIQNKENIGVYIHKHSIRVRVRVRL